ncbi:glycosyltransferase family 4 protein [Salinibacter ruber]|uniref:glycosyltransferase family 4 protein n=1 Tax=Salinibacter ruber TaxID=146919 RepID=UPI0020737D87|nr:glycosyltransferase family 4 protein [Salinibacter ruber]
MKVAYVLTEDISFHGTSGASAHVRNVVEQLEQRGHSVELVSRVSRSKNESEDSSDSSGKGLRSVASAVLPGTVKTAVKDWWVRRRNRRLIHENVEVLQWADVIYERDAYQSFGTQEIIDSVGTPWVLECNGIFWDEQSPFSTPVWPDSYRRRHVEKWKRADQLIVVSESFKKHVVQEGVSPEKITAIHNGVDVEPHRDISTSQVEGFREKWGLDRDVPTIGFLGHMLPWHRIDLLVNAIRVLRGNDYKVQGLLVGGGRWKEYKRKAKRNGLAELVTFTGPLPPEDVPVAVAAMDICTAPGIYEPGSPVKLFDYGAAGRPIVAANAPSVTEIITDEENGLLFEQGSLEGLVGALTRLVEDDELRNQLGAAAREKVEEEHTWEKVGQRTECVLSRVLDNSRN